MDLGFRVQGLRAWGLGFRVQGLTFESGAAKDVKRKLEELFGEHRSLV